MPLTYAIVAYLEGELASFIADVRARWTPEDAHLRPHITILPPVEVASDVEDIKAAVAQVSQSIASIAIGLGQVSSFAPVTPTLYLEIVPGRQQILAAHAKLLEAGLAGHFDHPFIPHLTLVKCPDLAMAGAIRPELVKDWGHYHGPRSARLTTLTLVEEAGPNHWDDLWHCSLQCE